MTGARWCASLLFAENTSPKLIQAHLGRSTIGVTFDHYGHLFPCDMDRIAEALDARRAAGSLSSGPIPLPHSE